MRNERRLSHLRYLACLLVVAGIGSAKAGEMEWPGARGDGVVVDHPPHPYGGPSSDTLFHEFPGGLVVW